MVHPERQPRATTTTSTLLPPPKPHDVTGDIFHNWNIWKRRLNLKRKTTNTHRASELCVVAREHLVAASRLHHLHHFHHLQHRHHQKCPLLPALQLHTEGEWELNERCRKTRTAD
nr:uncharacterized protein LOC129381538 [Dermacentor andersoni]